jgi:hypothetical protein
MDFENNLSSLRNIKENEYLAGECFLYDYEEIIKAINVKNKSAGGS